MQQYFIDDLSEKEYNNIIKRKHGEEVSVFFVFFRTFCEKEIEVCCFIKKECKKGFILWKTTEKRK